MKIFTVIFAALLILLAIGYGAWQRLGNVLPAVLPPTDAPAVSLSDTAAPQSLLKTGKPLPIPLIVPSGMQIGLFAQDVGKPRDLQFSPGGTLLVSNPDGGQIFALPDADVDGAADKTVVLLTGLRKPHGLAFYNNQLFVAEETAVSRYSWDEGQLAATFDKKLFDLPAGGRHFTRSLAFQDDGTLYVSIGSTCDTCFENNPWLASVIVSDADGTNPQVFAKGLRNAVFLAVRPQTDELWATEMGRDFLGDDLPQDEIDILKKGGDYGWPVCYGAQVFDTAFGQQTAAYCAGTIPPVYSLPAHVAPLGLAFVTPDLFPEDWQGDLLVALHGSWNSTVPVGYRVVKLNVEGDRITGQEDVVTGFIQGNQAAGRPVDITFGPEGYLYISDDKRGVIYIAGFAD